MIGKIAYNALLLIISGVLAAVLIWMLVNHNGSDVIVMTFLMFIGAVLAIRYCCCPMYNGRDRTQLYSLEPVIVHAPAHPTYIVIVNPGRHISIGLPVE